MPPGGLVARDDGVLDAEPGEAVARLQAARPAPDDDNGIVARRIRPLVVSHRAPRYWRRSRIRRVTVWSIL